MSVVLKKIDENRRSDLLLKRFQENIEPHLHKIAIESSRGTHIEDLASLVNMSVDTFSKYRRAFPELQLAIDKGRQESVEVAEDSLSRLAEGYYYNEILEKQHPKTFEVIERKVQKKYHHPDYRAIMAILLNKASDKWSKNPENSTPVNGIGIINNVDVSDNVIKKALNELQIRNEIKQVNDLEIDDYLDDEE